MLKRLLTVSLGGILLALFLFPGPADSGSLTESVRGYVLIQVEKNGEAWYVNPANDQRSFLGRPDDAFSIMYDTGLGISNADLAKIPISGEAATGDLSIRQRVAGRILIQVEKNGEAWYVYPKTLQRHYLGRPADAFSIMSGLGLGVTNASLAQVPEVADPIFVGAGDIAGCKDESDEPTAQLLDSIPGTVFTLGDNAYENGKASEFTSCYDPTWGRHRDRTRPSPGNHDYGTSGATGYYDYFGDLAGPSGRGFYQYEIGDWNVLSLNSNCSTIGGCGTTSAEYLWLADQLNQSSHRCTVAYMHHPPFSSGVHGNETAMADIWTLLVKNGVDLVLAGHDHNYERFAPLNSNGTTDHAAGARMFVVGTGGKPLRTVGSPLPGSQVLLNDSFGVLKLTLHPRSYSWEFVTTQAGAIADSGSFVCH